MTTGNEQKPRPLPGTHGLDAWWWPETQALFKRLGIPDNLRSQAVTIRFDMDRVRITHEYHGADVTKIEPDAAREG
jgi:hypothetical protein